MNSELQWLVQSWSQHVHPPQVGHLFEWLKRCRPRSEFRLMTIYPWAMVIFQTNGLPVTSEPFGSRTVVPGDLSNSKLQHLCYESLRKVLLSRKNVAINTLKINQFITHISYFGQIYCLCLLIITLILYEHSGTFCYFNAVPSTTKSGF